MTDPSSPQTFRFVLRRLDWGFRAFVVTDAGDFPIGLPQASKAACQEQVTNYLRRWQAHRRHERLRGHVASFTVTVDPDQDLDRLVVEFPTPKG
jgi:uncharacterized protein (DUF934 family)